MSLVNICPDIPDNWRGGVMDVSKVLGLHKSTISKAANKGKSFGGIDWILGKNGSKMFTGKEVKRFWRKNRFFFTLVESSVDKKLPAVFLSRRGAEGSLAALRIAY